MSWQRIDENTYIDDTLVTCAEYQLFIDEMREQGKYYQPDHWTSYQFPEGKAREPILGVRHSDAVAFCEWLTNRESGEGNYRLPYLLEANNYSYLAPVILPIGFWVSEIDNQIPFSWIGLAPANARSIDANRLLSGSSYRFLPMEHILFEPEEVFTRALDNAQNLALDLSFFKSDVLEIRKNLEQFTEFTYILHSLTELEEIISDIRKLDRFRTNEQRVQEFIMTDFRLDHDRADILIHAQELSSNLIVSLEKYVVAVYFRHDQKVHSKQEKIYHASMIAFSLHVDLYTLQERIAGRSPAFEGIRLVKERIR